MAARVRPDLDGVIGIFCQRPAALGRWNQQADPMDPVQAVRQMKWARDP